ncbi:MAG: hypothetical protein QM628_15595 [Propionicimonas sp.]
MNHPITPARVPLDLSAMLARVILALLTALTVVLLGLWLRASDALGFFSTLTSVTVSTLVAANLRGRRLGPPTAGAARLQPVVDVLAQYPGGGFVARTGFKRSVVALGIGLLVATGEQLLLVVFFDGLRLAPIWRGVVALTVVLIPVHAAFGWWRSKQQYTGTKFAGDLAGAVRRVVNPAQDAATANPFAQLPPAARVGLGALGRTALAVVGRIVVQLAIPALFSTPLSIAFVVVATITAIAGGPVFAAIGRTLKDKTTPAAPAPAAPVAPAAADVEEVAE